MSISPISIAVIDDHNLFRKGMIHLVNSLGLYTVVCEAMHGEDFIRQVEHQQIRPEIILLDVKMPVMNGFDTALWIRQHLPDAKVIAVSMENSDDTVIRMLKSGIKGYLSKDIEPGELDKAIQAVHNYGYYYTDYLTGKLIDAASQEKNTAVEISDREREFLQWACSDLTYKEIAEKMYLSVKTIDNYRESLFIKLEVKSRVGLALAAIRKGWISVEIS